MIPTAVVIAIFAAYAAAASLVSTGQVPLWEAWLGGALTALWVYRRRERPPERAAAAAWLRLVPLLLLAFVYVIVSELTTPGADAAMYAAIARALLKGSPDLSAAYPGVRVAMYPRGFSALVAALAPLFGMLKANLVAAAAAYVAYAYGVAAFLRLFVPARVAWGASVLLMFIARQVPLGLFNWGSNPTALAFGVTLLGVARGRGPLDVLYIVGGFSTHPLGALAGVLCAPFVFVAQRSWRLPLIVLAAAPAVLCFKYLGPELSPAERQWIVDWQLGENPVRAHHRIYVVDYLSAYSRQMGDLFAALGYLSIAAVLVFWRRHWRLAAMAFAGLVYVALLMRFGPRLPALGLFMYPDRMTLLWAVSFAPVMAAALYEVTNIAPARRAPAPGLIGFAVACALTAIAHAARPHVAPLVTRDDIALMPCVAKSVPEGEVITAAYGEGGQWFAAVTGHPITQAHVHCSVFDEVRAQRKHLQSRYQYFGGPAVYGSPPIPTYEAVETLCATDGARLVRLKAPVSADVAM